MVSSTSNKASPAQTGSAGSPLRKFTWRDVAAHNTQESCWLIVGQGVYDVTQWLPLHPGGQEMLVLAAGRDCTDLFTCYHPFTDKPQQVLEKYKIGFVESSDLEFPQYRPDTGFYKELRQKVGDYFRSTGKHYKDPLPGAVRLLGMVLVAIVSFCIAHSPEYSWIVRILAAQLFGVAQALPLLHVMHDASHTSIGYNQSYWSFFGRSTMDWFAGASLTSWFHQHVVGHHLYTNVVGADPDLPVVKEGDLRRVSDHQVWQFLYRFQYLYLGPLYGFLTLKFRIQDITGVIALSNGPIRVNVNMVRELLYQFAVKSFWFCWRFIVPYSLGVPIKDILILFMFSELATGWWLALNFQVSHVSPSAVFPTIDSAPSFSDEWAISQVKTTVDYAHDDPVATFLCGALNYQTVHHLFPAVSQYHYPAIAPIIKEVCKKHGVTYTYIPTFRQALYLHFKHLYNMGQKTVA